MFFKKVENHRSKWLYYLSVYCSSAIARRNRNVFFKECMCFCERFVDNSTSLCFVNSRICSFSLRVWYRVILISAHWFKCLFMMFWIAHGRDVIATDFISSSSVYFALQHLPNYSKHFLRKAHCFVFRKAFLLIIC